MGYVRISEKYYNIFRKYVINIRVDTNSMGIQDKNAFWENYNILAYVWEYLILKTNILEMNTLCCSKVPIDAEVLVFKVAL